MASESIKKTDNLPARFPDLPAERRQRIVLDGSDPSHLFEREIRGMEISGVLRNHRTARKCNVVESVFLSLIVERVDFARCDFKDSALRSSKFIESSFGSSTFAYNLIANCSFDRCSFEDTDIQNCAFEQTVFTECDLSNLLIKNCTFNGCEFRGCRTSNKLFETCRLTESLFYETQLQIQTVAENFGLRRSQVHEYLRDNRMDCPHRQIKHFALRQWLRVGDGHPLHALSVEYFLRESLLEGSKYLDDSLNIASWIPRFRTAGSFAVVLSRWGDFLLWLYGRNELTVHSVICLHSMTGELLRRFEDQPSNAPVLTSIRGTHLSLAQIVDRYLVLLEECSFHFQEHVCLLVEGHHTKTSYYRALMLLFERAPANITKLVKHNSPWDLGITFTSGGAAIFFFAVFLSTRTQLELSRIREKLAQKRRLPSPQKAPKRISGRKELSTEPILSIDFGGNQEMKSIPNIRLKAYLPGNLVADLKLDINSRSISKLRKTIKDLL